jgi:hypothetical protein
MLRSGSARTGTPDSTRDQQSLGDLVALALKDVSQLVSYEIALAKKEFKVDLRRAGIGGGAVMFILMVAYPMLFMLLFAEAYGLHAAFSNQPLWLCFIYSAATCLFFAIIVGLIGFFFAKKVTGMKLTRKTVSEDISMLKQRGGSGTSAVGDGKAEEIDDRKTPSLTSGQAPASVPARSLPR